MLDQFKKTDAIVSGNTYKVGTPVVEDGFYVCVPCGNKKYFKAGTRFPSCLMCLGKERKLFRRGLELWERVSNNKKSGGDGQRSNKS